MNIFTITGFMPVLLAVAAAAVVLNAAGRRGALKKQGTAWTLTIVMICAAVGIGQARAHAYGAQEPYPAVPPYASAAPAIPPYAVPAAADSFVWDNARVLSGKTVRELDGRNGELWEDYRVTIGVVTCNYGGDGLDDYALDLAEQMGLGGYDMIVVLDISGDSYRLLQGNDIRRDFTDSDRSDYAYAYMERLFARGDYDRAVLQLTEALEDWYDDYFD